MFYTFPIIETIDDVLPAIEGVDEIIVADRGDHTIINYVVVTPDTFPPIKVAGGSAKMREQRARINAIRRECRGLIFDKDGKIIRRPFHKFFNANEREETLFPKIPFDQPHQFLEKLDGSSIAPFIVNGELRWGTRMGVTDVADQVLPFIADRPWFIDYARRVIENGWTPIFEWCSRQQKIVIDHPEERLVLTAARNMRDGRYIDAAQLEMTAVTGPIPVVQQLPIESITCAEDIHAMSMDDVGEGTVIRFDNGHMVKIKTAEYCRIHGVKERVEEERHVVLDLIKGDFDDVTALLPFEDVERLRKYAQKFWEARGAFIRSLHEKITTVPGMFKTRKEFALSDKSAYTSFEIRAIFHFWDYHLYEGAGACHYYDVDEQLVAKYVDDGLIIPNCGTRTKFGEMKNQVFPNISFNRY